MATEREAACIYYKCEGECEKGKKGIFKKTCQICKKYKARKGDSFSHKNLKKQKLEKLKEYDVKQMMKDY